MLRVGYDLNPCVAYRVAVLKKLPRDITQGLALKVHRLKLLEEGFIIRGDPAADEIISLAVDYSTMHGRASRKKSRRLREEVITPERDYRAETDDREVYLRGRQLIVRNVVDNRSPFALYRGFSLHKIEEARGCRPSFIGFVNSLILTLYPCPLRSPQSNRDKVRE